MICILNYVNLPDGLHIQLDKHFGPGDLLEWVDENYPRWTSLGITIVRE